MQRFVVIVLGSLALVVIGGILLTMLQKNRANQNLLYSINNFRELGQFSELYLTKEGIERPVDPRQALAPDPRFAPQPLPELEALGLVAAIPAGTAGRMDLPVTERLSWIYTLMPTFNQKRQATAEMHAGISPVEPWNSGTNRPFAERPLQVTFSFANPPKVAPGEAAPTQIVGITGLGNDSGNLPTPRSGCFRYDAPTLFPSITDGLSHTIMLADVSTNLGPWLQGGFSSARGLNDSETALSAIGIGGQFGGNHTEGALFGFADHSVRIYTNRTNARILAALMTINGGNGEALPGE